MTGKKSKLHTLDELEGLLTSIKDKFQWLGDYL